MAGSCAIGEIEIGSVASDSSVFLASVWSTTGGAGCVMAAGVGVKIVGFAAGGTTKRRFRVKLDRSVT
jgi:hypothetical protein